MVGTLSSPQKRAKGIIAYFDLRYLLCNNFLGDCRKNLNEETIQMLVFISYHIQDKEVAREIALFLTAENINVWFDEWEISAGDSIVEQINAGLLGCTHFLILWSRNASTSNWVRRELHSTLNQAIKDRIPRVIPIILDDTPLPKLIADIRYIRYSGGTEKDRNNIVNSVTGHGPSFNFIKAIVKKYHEVITNHEGGDPFGLRACPRCGSTRLEGGSYTDDERDEVYYVLACKECGWGDWTQ